MKQDKTVVVIISIGILVASILGVGLWMFTPRDSNSLLISSSDSNTLITDNGNFDVGAHLQSGDSSTIKLDSDETEDDQDVIVIVGKSADEEQDDSAEQSVLTQSALAHANNETYVANAQKTNTDIAKRATARTKQAPSASATEVQKDVLTYDDKNDQQETVSVAAPVIAQKPKIQKKQSTLQTDTLIASEPKNSVKKTQTQEERSTVYWIQVASSTKKDGISSLKKNVDERGFHGKILQVQVNGKQFYRLRYGPYTDKNDAQNFAHWVRNIPGLDKSYITETYE